MPRKEKGPFPPSVPVHLRKAEADIAKGLLTSEQWEKQELAAFHLLPGQGRRPPVASQPVLSS